MVEKSIGGLGFSLCKRSVNSKKYWLFRRKRITRSPSCSMSKVTSPLYNSKISICDDYGKKPRMPADGKHTFNRTLISKSAVKLPIRAPSFLSSFFILFRVQDSPNFSSVWNSLTQLSCSKSAANDSWFPSNVTNTLGKNADSNARATTSLQDFWQRKKKRKQSFKVSVDTCGGRWAGLLEIRDLTGPFLPRNERQGALPPRHVRTSQFSQRVCSPWSHHSSTC